MFKAIAFSKNILTFVVPLITCCCLNSTVYSQSVVTQTGVTRVVVDAGHGGLDPGSVGKNLKEKDVNLAVALLVGKMITDSFPSVEVIYTRKKDVFVAIGERSNIANKNNADLFISIHANSISKATAKGSETFVMGTQGSAANMEVAKRENAVITFEDDYTSKYEGYDPNSPESFIMLSLMQNVHLDQSLQMASLVQEELGTYPITVNRGVKQALFLVLWRTAMPSILVEMGFLSNPDDEKILASKAGQEQIARSIFRAFKNYKLYYNRLNELTNATAVPAKPVEEKVKESVAEPQKSSKITYRVQIKSGKTKLPLNSKEFKSFNDVSVFYSNNLYKYAVGNFSSREEAQKYCTDVVRKKIKDAFVICVENEKIVPLKK